MKLNVSSIILWLGVLLSASGIVFFFAYNWQDMHKFLKLFTIWVIIFSSVVIYLRADSSVVAHTSLWVAIVGVVAISTSAINWLTWLIILNLSISLYMAQALHVEFRDVLVVKILLAFLTSSMAIKFIVAKSKPLTSIGKGYLKLPWVAHVSILFATILSSVGIIVFLGMINLLTKDTLIIFGIIILSMAIIMRKNVDNSLNIYYLTYCK